MSEEVTKLPFSLTGLFCEEVRQEKSELVTLIGVFPDNINVTQVPGAFPRMAFYVRIMLDPEFDSGAIGLKVIEGDGAEISLEGFDREFVNQQRESARQTGTALVGLISVAKAMPLRINAVGPIKIIATIQGADYICGTLNVQVPNKQEEAEATPTAASAS